MFLLNNYMRKVFNLERDIRRTDWIVSKIRSKETYAQNFYAALCNNNFAPKDMWCILKNIKWNCDWRYAANLIAEIRETEDYLAWYCSGTGFKGTDFAGFVEESYVTEEIKEDIDNIGWLILTDFSIDIQD